MHENITIIGIAGGTGSGKTTVVKKVVEALPPHHVAVVPLDSYYNDTTELTEEERRAINFDHPPRRFRLEVADQTSKRFA